MGAPPMHPLAPALVPVAVPVRPKGTSMAAIPSTLCSTPGTLCTSMAAIPRIDVGPLFHGTDRKPDTLRALRAALVDGPGFVRLFVADSILPHTLINTCYDRTKVPPPPC